MRLRSDLSSRLLCADDLQPDPDCAILIPDRGRETSAWHSGAVVPLCPSEDSPVEGSELHLSNPALRALASLLRTVSALEGQRSGSHDALPGFSLPKANHAASLQIDPRKDAPCRSEVAEWDSVARVDRKQVRVADGSTDLSSTKSMGLTLDAQWSPDPASRILFATTNLPGAPEVEVGSAWFD